MSDLSHDVFTLGRCIKAEKVAMTNNNSKSKSIETLVEEIFEMWWNCSGHPMNMLGPYRDIGVGVVPADLRLILRACLSSGTLSSTLTMPNLNLMSTFSFHFMSCF
jgi:hypothetical protein